ncbi:hypothetical protein D3C71_1309130 [compost metagenome]
MTVQNPFRVARRAGGVAERAGGILVEYRPGVAGGSLLKQIFIAQQVVDAGVFGHTRLIGHGDERLDPIAAPGDGLDQRQEGQVEEDVLVFRVIGDVGDLVFMQARVDGMDNGTHAGNAVVQLQVPIAIPCQCADPFGRPGAQVCQCAGHLTRAVMAVAEGVAMDITLDPPRHDLRIAMMAIGMHDE